MRIPISFLVAGLLAACGSDDPPRESDTISIEIPDDTADMAEDAPDADAENAAQPPPEREAAPGTARAAADVAQGYLEQIRSGDAVGALIAWEGDAAAAEATAQRFAALGPFAFEVGEPGRIEAGAGQRYVTVPFRATGSGEGGQSLLGRITLHRAGDIDGATLDQRRWRIRSVEFGDAAPRSAQAPDGTSAVYACEDGARYAAAFDNLAGTVTLRQDDERVAVLAQQRAGSGIWYRGGGAELRGKGDTATITLPGAAPVECEAT